MIVHLPKTNEYFVPFLPSDNHRLLPLIQQEIENAKKNKPKANRGDLTLIADLLTAFLDMTESKNAYFCLKFAGDMFRYIKEHADVGPKVYEKALIRLQRAMRRNNFDPMSPGMDQIAARLLHMLEYEDIIATPDSYSLWIQDLEGNENMFEES